MELNAEKAYPSLCSVRALSDGQYGYQHKQRQEQGERCDDLEIFALDVHCGYHENHSNNQQSGMAQDGAEIAAALERQCARSAEHLDDADDTEEEEHHPNDAVTFDLEF